MQPLWPLFVLLMLGCGGTTNPPATSDDDRRRREDEAVRAQMAQVAADQTSRDHEIAERDASVASPEETPEHRLRKDCDATRFLRAERRKAADATRAADARRAEQQKVVEYRKKNCKKSEQAVRGYTGQLCMDTDGYVVACQGAVGIQVVYDCPPNGPVGARGRVVAGQVLSGDSVDASGNPERRIITRKPGEVISADGTRPAPILPSDETCRAFDDAAPK